MLQPKEVGRPASYGEEALAQERDTPLICPVCWGKDNLSQLTRDGFCPNCDKQFDKGLSLAVVERSTKFRGLYEQEMIRMNTALQVKQPSALDVGQKELDLMKKRVRGMMVVGDLAKFGPYADAAVEAAAFFCYTHGLDPSNPGEFWIMPKVQREKDDSGKWKETIVGFMHGPGYKGLMRSARNQSPFTIDESSIEIIYGEKEPDRIRQMRANVCKRCSGVVGECSNCNGTGWWKGNVGSPCLHCGGVKASSSQPAKQGTGVKTCDRCNSTGEVDPKDVIVARVPLHRIDVYERAARANKEAYEVNKAAGSTVIPYLPYSPTWGTSVHQKGDQIPVGRSGEWDAIKDATNDALRKAYDLNYDLVSRYRDMPETLTTIVGEPVYVDEQPQPEEVEEGVTEEIPAEDDQIISAAEYRQLKQDIVSNKNITDGQTLSYIKSIVGSEYNPTNLTRGLVKKVRASLVESSK